MKVAAPKPSSPELKWFAGLDYYSEEGIGVVFGRSWKFAMLEAGINMEEYRIGMKVRF